VIIFALAVFSPAPLDAKADLNNESFVPYPAWYFLALYAMLDIVGNFPPAIVQIASLFATIVGPTLLIVLLIALPFIDKNPSRRPSRRPWVLAITALVMVGAIGLSFIGQRNVVEQQLAHHLIGPGAIANQPATSTTASQTGPAGTASSTSSSATQGGSTPATAGAGASVYTANCAGCHGAAGTGLAGQFPPLAGNAFVTGDKKQVIGVVLNGLNKKIEVNGATYNAPMPAWKGQLTNKQIADVITYVRNAWGNKGTTVTEADVTGYKP
jgi:mono/diheme cytochrome c family protein